LRFVTGLQELLVSYRLHCYVTELQIVQVSYRLQCFVTEPQVLQVSYRVQNHNMQAYHLTFARNTSNANVRQRLHFFNLFTYMPGIGSMFTTNLGSALIKLSNA
jgi:ubiquinone/menaquinone biosynthesis C-methylase UbiE